MIRVLMFPGCLDLLVVPFLVFIYLGPDRPLTIAATIAAVRVLFVHLFFRKHVYLTSRDMTYNLILFSLSVGYLLVGGQGWKAAVSAYLEVGGLAAILFIICAELRSRIGRSRG